MPNPNKIYFYCQKLGCLMPHLQSSPLQLLCLTFVLFYKVLIHIIALFITFFLIILSHILPADEKYKCILQFIWNRFLIHDLIMASFLIKFHATFSIGLRSLSLIKFVFPLVVVKVMISSPTNSLCMLDSHDNNLMSSKEISIFNKAANKV